MTVELNLQKHVVPKQEKHNAKLEGEKFCLVVTSGNITFYTAWFFGDEEKQNKVLNETINNLRNAEVVVRKD